MTAGLLLYFGNRWSKILLEGGDRLDKFTLPEIPDIARGAVIPDSVRRNIENEERRVKAERKNKLYFWGGIASTILGVIAGWLLGKFC